MYDLILIEDVKNRLLLRSVIVFTNLFAQINSITMCLIKIYQTIGRFHSIFDCFEVALAVAIMKQNRHQFDQDYL